MKNKMQEPYTEVQMKKDIDLALQNAPAVAEAFDTTTPEFDTFVSGLQANLSNHGVMPTDFDAQILQMYPNGESQEGEARLKFIALRTALKIAEGWRNLEEITTPVHITLVQALYHEEERIKSRSKENPHGEGSLDYKMDILQQMRSQNPNISFSVILVDDGCDRGSGKVAQDIIDNSAIKGVDAQVYFLEEGINSNDPELPSGITKGKDSVKGGAMLYGFAKAKHVKAPEGAAHIIVDNDADLSIHPAQIPTLILPIIKGEALVAAGSRREPTSVKLIGEKRNKRGQLFINLWQSLLPNLASRITDTNRGFKAFHIDVIDDLLAEVEDRKFPYQIENLVVSLKHGYEVKAVPVSYIDSEALSTQEGNAAQTYLNQVKNILDMAQRHGEQFDVDLADIIDQLVEKGDEGEEVWRRIEEQCSTAEEVKAFFQEQ